MVFMPFMVKYRSAIRMNVIHSRVLYLNLICVYLRVSAAKLAGNAHCGLPLQTAPPLELRKWGKGFTFYVLSFKSYV